MPMYTSEEVENLMKHAWINGKTFATHFIELLAMRMEQKSKECAKEIHELVKLADSIKAPDELLPKLPK